MPYPNSPFVENFNSKLINSLLVEKSENKKTVSRANYILSEFAVGSTELLNGIFFRFQTMI